MHTLVESHQPSHLHKPDSLLYDREGCQVYGLSADVLLDCSPETFYLNSMATQAITQEAVTQAAEKLGRSLEGHQADLLCTYLDQLIKWNKKMNLVGKTSWQQVFDTLIVDSLFLADFIEGLPLAEQPLSLDLGAGAGLPGIPLRCLWQRGVYWLVEVREKRSLFMRSVLGRMGLPGTHVFHGRAEDALTRLAESGHSATADFILSRAFMPWRKLLDFTHPMLKQGGILVILANDPPPTERDIPEGWQLADVASYPAAGDERYFWSLMKS